MKPCLNITNPKIVSRVIIILTHFTWVLPIVELMIRLVAFLQEDRHSPQTPTIKQLTLTMTIVALS